MTIIQVESGVETPFLRSNSPHPHPTPLENEFFCNWLLPYDFASKVKTVLTHWSPVFDSFWIDLGLFDGG